VEIGCVGWKRQTATPSVTASGAGVGELENSSQVSGAVTVNWKVALRSGCSNSANTRRASGTSNCV